MRVVKASFSFIVLLAIMLLAINIIDTNNVFYFFVSFSKPHIVMIVLVYLLFLFVAPLVLRAALRKFRIRPKLISLLGIIQCGVLSNYIAPFGSGSLVTRGILLKKLYAVSMADSTAIFSLMGFLTLLVNFMIVGGLFVFCGLRAGPIDFGYAAIRILPIVALLLGLGVILWAKYGVLPRIPIPAFVRQLLATLTGYSRRFLLLASGLFLVQFLLSVLVYLVYFDALNVPVSIITCAWLMAMNFLFLSVSITPGNLGVKELGLLGVGSLLGIAKEPLLAILVVDRLVTFVFAATFAVYFVWVNGKDVLRKS